VTADAEQRDESGVRQRTRRAILDAAIAIWARDFSASLSDVADHAEVSRSTLHRYFPDRQSLIDASLVDASTTIERETTAAVAGCTTAREELETLMRVLVDRGEMLIFLFADPDRFSGNPHWDESEDENLYELIERAQQEGTLTAEFVPAWVQGVFYSLAYVAAESINAGQMPRHRAADVAVQTFFYGAGSR